MRVFSFTPLLVVGLIGDVCLMKWKLRFGFDVQTGINAKFYISLELMPLAAAFLKLEGRAMGLTFRPVLSADAKRAKVGGRFDLGVELISLAVRAGIRYPVIRRCEACTGGRWFRICIPYPCGLDWGGESSWDFDRISLGTGGVHNILDALGSDEDSSPPRLGTIEFRQTGPKHAAVKMAEYARTHPKRFSAVSVARTLTAAL